MLEFNRCGNYITVTGEFDKNAPGGFGSVNLHVHAALWRQLLSELNNYDVHGRLALCDCENKPCEKFLSGKES